MVDANVGWRGTRRNKKITKKIAELPLAITARTLPLFNEPATLCEGITKTSRRLQEGSTKPSWRFHALKAQLRRLGGFTKPPRRVCGGTSWDSSTMLPVIVLDQYYTVVYFELRALRNPL